MYSLTSKLQPAAMVCNLNRSFTKNSRFIQPNGHSAILISNKLTGFYLLPLYLPRTQALCIVIWLACPLRGPRRSIRFSPSRAVPRALNDVNKPKRLGTRQPLYCATEEK